MIHDPEPSHPAQIKGKGLLSTWVWTPLEEVRYIGGAVALVPSHGSGTTSDPRVRGSSGGGGGRGGGRDGDNDGKYSAGGEGALGGGSNQASMGTGVGYHGFHAFTGGSTEGGEGEGEGDGGEGEGGAGGGGEGVPRRSRRGAYVGSLAARIAMALGNANASVSEALETAGGGGEGGAAGGGGAGALLLGTGGSSCTSSEAALAQQLSFTAALAPSFRKSRLRNEGSYL